jgi:hypothetical protein
MAMNRYWDKQSEKVVFLGKNLSSLVRCGTMLKKRAGRQFEGVWRRVSVNWTVMGTLISFMSTGLYPVISLTPTKNCKTFVERRRSKVSV